MNQKARILVVDDDEAGRYAVARCLRQAGHDVLEAATAKQCFDALAHHHCSLIVLDVKLPDSSGTDACRELKADPRTAHIPVIQTSALFTATRDRIQGLESGADAYLVAPFDERELLAHVTQLLRVRRVEDELRDREERLRQAAGLVGLCLYTWRPHTGELQWEPGIKPMWGLPPDRPINYDVWRAGVHPDDRPAVDERVARSLDPASGGLYEAEYRVNGADGVQRWVSTRGRTTFADGKPVLQLGVVVDITERKRAEALLNTDLAALTRLHDLSRKRLGPGGLPELLQGIMDAAVAIVGAQRGTLQLLEADSLRIVAHHGHQAPFLEFFAAAENRASVCGEATRRGERVVVPDVEDSPMFAGTPSLAVFRQAGVRAVQSTPLLSRSGALLGMISTQWTQPYRPDVHDLWRIDLLARQAADTVEQARADAVLRESEERFRSLADGTPVMIWVHDAQGALRFTNRAWHDFFGPGLDQAPGRNWKPLVHPDDVPGYVDLFLQCHAERREFHACARARRHDGQWRWIESFAAPRFSADGEYLGMAGSSVDITERQRAQEILARDKQDLERLVLERTASLKELVAELEHFSYTITHDMRAPLRAMQGFAEITSEALDAGRLAEAAEFLRRIKLSASRMDALITDALNYSRAVRSELPVGPIDVGPLLRGMLDTYPDFQENNGRIVLDRDLPRVMGNEAGLTQCFSNLISNALKFTPPGVKPDVRVRAELRDGWVRLWVEDHGIGIPKNFLPRVFDMFSRGSNPAAGTGIGLALVRKVVDRMGGRIGVESEPGHGSRFWLELRPGDPRQPTLPHSTLAPAAT